MRRALFEGLVRRPLTEAPMVADDAALAELAANVDRAARRRSDGSPVLAAGDRSQFPCGMLRPNTAVERGIH